jgi:hypothetical protein
MGDSGLLLGRPKGPEEFALEGDEEEEGDLDAFNDETFGGEAAEWEESGNVSPFQGSYPSIFCHRGISEGRRMLL